MVYINHSWALPDNLYEQLKEYSARGKILTWIATAAVWTMGRFDVCHKNDWDRFTMHCNGAKKNECPSYIDFFSMQNLWFSLFIVL